jgi:uncharacterized membrane protein YgcG
MVGRYRFLVFPFLIVSGLAGCTGVPDFTAPDVGRYSDGSDIHVADIVDRVKCEILEAAIARPELRTEKYQVGVLLNLQVNDNDGVAPSFNFIHPIDLVPGAQSAMQSLTYALSAQYNGTRLRTYSQSYLFIVDDMFDPHVVLLPGQKLTDAQANAERQYTHCLPGPDKHARFAFNGIDLTHDLGITEVANLGLDSISPVDQVVGQQMVVTAPINTGYVSPTTTNQMVFPCAGGTTEESACTPPIFGSTEQFAVARSIGVGPNWTLLRFKGPTASGGGSGAGGAGAGAGGGTSGSSSGSSGGSSGLLNFGRTDTHALWIAFVPTGGRLVNPPAVPPVPPSETSAYQELHSHSFSLLSAPLRSSREKELKALIPRQQAQKQAEAEARATALVRTQNAAATAQGVINTMIFQNLQSLGP